MARPVSAFKPEYCEIAERVLASGESLAAVCCEIGCGRTTLYDWRDRHPEFAASLEYGVQMSQRVWEEKGRAGIDGETERFAGTPWMFVMKARFHQDYVEKKEDKETNNTNTLIEKLIDRL